MVGKIGFVLGLGFGILSTKLIFSKPKKDTLRTPINSFLITDNETLEEENFSFFERVKKQCTNLFNITINGVKEPVIYNCLLFNIAKLDMYDQSLLYVGFFNTWFHVFSIKNTRLSYQIMILQKEILKNPHNLTYKVFTIIKQYINHKACIEKTEE